MAKKTNAYYDGCKRIRKMMTEAGIYEARYELQIEQAVETIVEIADIRAIIKKEGRVLVEEKTGGIGAKRVPHPLLDYLDKCEKRLANIYGVLGLNKSQEKKAETREAKRQDMDGVQTFFAGRRG